MPAQEGERIIYASNDSYFANREAAICVCGPTNMCSSSNIYMCRLKSIIWEGRRYCWSMMSIWMHGAFVECSGWRRNDFCWTRASRQLRQVTAEEHCGDHPVRWTPHAPTPLSEPPSCTRPLAKSHFYPDLLGEIFFALEGVLKGRLGGTSSMAWNVTTGKDGNPRHAKLAATF